MKEFVLNPEKLEIKNFKGEVRVSLPNYPTRMKYLRDMNFSFDKKGEVEKDMDMVGVLEKFYDLAEEHVSKVDLIFDDGISKEKMNSVEDLSCYEEGAEIIQKIGNVIVNGVQLGKRLGSQSSPSVK